MVDPVTCASRLAAEVSRAEAVLRTCDKQRTVLQALWEAEEAGIKFPAYAASLWNLIEEVQATIVLNPLAQNRARLEAAIRAGPMALIGPHNNLGPREFVAQALGANSVIERLEGHHAILVATGRCATVDNARVQAILAQLDELQDSAFGDDSVSIFVRQKVAQLRAMIERYSLFGPEAVAHEIFSLNGGLEEMAENGLRVIKSDIVRVSKLILDVLVYAHAAHQGILWAVDSTRKLLPPS